MSLRAPCRSLAFSANDRRLIEEAILNRVFGVTR